MSLCVDLADLQRWVGREERRDQVIDPFPARALAGLLDRADAPEPGQPLPLPWHWLYFLDTPARATIGVDGHPMRGGFLPPVPLPRRMWAAGTLEVDAPLIVGRWASKVSRVKSVELKEGKTGPLVFVTVSHELQQDGRRCLREEQSLVYRDAPTSMSALPPGAAAPESRAWTRSFQPDPALLFRYSALTYNGHRIHYDRDYAVSEEFYPGLVVHGPLLATMLLDLLRSERPEATLLHFEFRALRPAFDASPLRIEGTPDSAGARLWTQDADGFVGMKASARWA